MKGEANSIEYEIQLTPLALEMLAELTSSPLMNQRDSNLPKQRQLSGQLVG